MTPARALLRRRGGLCDEEVIGVARKLIESARSLRDRFRWPGGRPPNMGGAVPAW
jgi:hypothetical protein